jgi:hypothetical protein
MDALRFETTCQDAKQTVESGETLMDCVHRELTGFSFSEISLKSDASRRDFKVALASMQRASIAGPGRVPIASLAEALSLASAISSAERKAADHVAETGHGATVAVARFQFSREAASLAVGRLSGCGDADAGANVDATAIKATVVQLDSDGIHQDWEISLVWQAGATLRLSANTVNGTPCGTGAVVVDVQAASSDFVLQARNVRLKAGGPWTKSSQGICAPRGSRAAAVDALVHGLACVLCVRAADPVEKSLRPDNLRIRALHIDERRRTVSP